MVYRLSRLAFLAESAFITSEGVHFSSYFSVVAIGISRQQFRQAMLTTDTCLCLQIGELQLCMEGLGFWKHGRPHKSATAELSQERMMHHDVDCYSLLFCS